MRKQYNHTQVELSEKSGVGLRVAKTTAHKSGPLGSFQAHPMRHPSKNFTSGAPYTDQRVVGIGLGAPPSWYGMKFCLKKVFFSHK